MYRLPQIAILLLMLAVNLSAQTSSPHGEGFAINCADCHTSDSWQIDLSYVTFDHDTLAFPLEGQHERIDCKACHESLIFSEVKNECASCHLDIHQQTVGTDCARCHTAQSWIVDNVTSIHEKIAFPLIGVHAQINCYDCHLDISEMRFDPIGTECISCHQEDFVATTNPDHVAAGFSTDCSECHGLNSFGWTGTDFNHGFFPLTGGHDIDDCAACHTSDNYSDISADCYSCHQSDFETSNNPDHQASGFSTNCAECHTTDPGWSPAEYRQHDSDFFPIYSGKHAGEWVSCAECHTDESNFAFFDCTTCHTNPSTDNEHQGINGYVYNSPACLACHPTGSEDDNFNHDQTGFPLTGAHIGPDCIECHVDGFANTSSECVSCHEMDFTQTNNPNHVALGLSNDCASCHTTDPGWSPADFPVHDNYYPLNGAHAVIADDCIQCHDGDYTNTPNTCFGCHSSDYNQTDDPNHAVLQFSTECQSCHNEDAWEPASFDHDSQFFPIYSGAHEGEWTACVDCHTNPANYADFTCTTCHMNPETDEDHIGVSGYLFNSPACLACHPTGSADMVFDHNNTGFPLTGAHVGTDCFACHSAGFEGTPTDCAACHDQDFTQSNNPNHTELGIPMDCAMCHTTDPGWSPGTFPIHDDYYVLQGAHTGIANDCAICHNGDYTNTPNTCAGCHQSDYDATTNPDHDAAMISNDCASCHNEDAWTPAPGFDHDAFYPLNGAHAIIAMDCALCHIDGNYINTPNTCEGCHIDDYNQTSNPDHSIAMFPTDCASCHSEDAWTPTNFDHDGQFFPIYSGEHAGEWTDCIDCHDNPNNFADFTCITCHMNPETDDEHEGVSGYSYNSPACLACHPTGNADDIFDHNSTGFSLSGGHNLVDCIDCHFDGFVGTSSECASCHDDDFNQTSNPDHQSLGLSMDCQECHTTDPGWSPAQFTNHNDFYTLNGAHALIATDCAACHNGDYMNTPNTCAGCHQSDYDGAANPDHDQAMFPPDCAECHSEDAWTPAPGFVHDEYYPLNGAHAGIAMDCAECHIGGDYNNTPNTCDGCHINEYNATTNPDHQTAMFPTDCAECHSEDAWTPSTFDHDSQFFPIYSGTHAGAWSDCAECHTNPNNFTEFTCTSCHEHNQGETDNIHTGVNGYTYNDMACLICHPNGLGDEGFDHNMTSFPLTGAHLGTLCLDCHEDGFAGTPTNCDACHMEDFNMSSNPNHAALGIPTDCETCHSTAPGWIPALFPIHDNYYPLTGAHNEIADDCMACHDGDYNNTPNDCAGCHQEDYNTTGNPNHSALGISTNCTECHTTDPGWTPADFPNHDNYWPFSGAHIPIANDCAACHNGDYNNTPNTCQGCHIDEYNASSNPNHQSLGIPTNCDNCHTTEPGWTPAGFPIHDNYYPLTGAHKPIENECALCHNGDYNNTPNTCDGCHLDDYNMSSNPNHQSLGIPTNCDNCHTTDPGWTPADFPIHDNYYPLTGAHAPISDQCATCHNGDYNNTPNTCDGCHMPDYNSSSNPSHTSLGLPTNCDMCHTTIPDWMPADFPIHDDYYVLEGAHALIADDCVVCHNGDYNNTPNTCFGCHQTDYNATTNPDHATAGFPTDCESCHNQTAWIPSTFDHDNMYFPIYSGRHDGEWNMCSDCHNVPSNYSIFTCIDCHEHNNQTEVDSQHDDVPGYSYDSNACYQCHPTGED